MKPANRSSAIWLVAAVGLGLLIAVWWPRHSEPTLGQAANSGSAGTAASAARADVEPVAQPMAKSQVATQRAVTSPPAASGTPLFREYRDAADLRVFVEKAKKAPEGGGIYYATMALLDCMSMRASPLVGAQAAAQRRRTLATNPTESTPGQLAALDWLETRCAGFTPDELRPRELELLAAAGKGKDKLYELRSKVMSQAASARGDPQRRSALLEEMLQSGDPVLTEQAVWMAGQSNASQAAATAYLDNEAYAGIGADHFALALRLMSCRLADSCATKDLQTHHDCAVDARCVNSIAEGIERDAGSMKDHQRISRVADRLLAVVRAADPAPLMPAR